MIALHRRLFWKVYLILLTSLVVVAVSMGAVWWLLGQTPQERWGAFRIHVTNELIPAEDRPTGTIAAAVHRLSSEIGADVSVYAKNGELIVAEGRPVFLREGVAQHEFRRVMRIDLPDGRAVVARLRPPLQDPGLRILTVMVVVAGGVGLAAFPVTARLTRRLEALRSGMARWGAGETAARVDESGSDEVALVARTFNSAAERLDLLLTSQKALLANASHELRSPLARLRIAMELWLRDPIPATHAEIVRNLAEVDVLVDEILLSSRLDHPSSFVGLTERVDLLGLAAEEAVRMGASVDGDAIEIAGNAALLRRLLRNLLENAVRHGKAPIHVTVADLGAQAEIVVSDQGVGIPPEERERVFEPFYRPQGRSEQGGGWGLGLSLVRQIAVRHGGRVTCTEGENGTGSHFVVTLTLGHVADMRQPAGLTGDHAKVEQALHLGGAPKGGIAVPTGL